METVIESRKVSVIVPVYNPPIPMLERCLNSIKIQSYNDIEVIIIDDGSEESIGHYCDIYVASDDRFRVYHIKNSGVSAARNRGIEEAKGFFMAFVDADDYLEQDFFSILVKDALEHNVDCVVAGCRYIASNKSVESTRNKNNRSLISGYQAIHDLMYMKKPYSHIEVTACWGKLYKSEILKEVRFTEGLIIGEDCLFNFEYYSKCVKVLYQDNSIYNYVINDSSVMNGKYKIEMLKTLSVLEDIINTESDKEIKKALTCRIVNMAFVVLHMMSSDDLISNDYRIVKSVIEKYRNKVLFDVYARIKVRAAIILSYVNLKIVYRLI